MKLSGINIASKAMIGLLVNQKTLMEHDNLTAAGPLGAMEPTALAN
jgi:hypothetical protein